MSRRNLEHEAATALEAAGFFVERQAHRNARNDQRYRELIADITAWGGDDAGELAPEVVVEVKAKLPRALDRELAQLSRMATVARARRAFVFDGSWREADASFTKLETAQCPEPARPVSRARVSSSVLEQSDLASTR